MTRSWTLFSLLLLAINGYNAINLEELYDVTSSDSDILPRGLDKWQYIKLDVPVHLYTEKYDTIYVRICYEKFKFEEITKNIFSKNVILFVSHI